MYLLSKMMKSMIYHNCTKDMKITVLLIYNDESRAIIPCTENDNGCGSDDDVVAMIRLGCVWIQQSICKGRIGSARNKGGRRPNVKTSCL